MIRQVLHAQLAMTLSRHPRSKPYYTAEDLLGFGGPRHADATEDECLTRDTTLPPAVSIVVEGTNPPALTFKASRWRSWLRRA